MRRVWPLFLFAVAFACDFLKEICNTVTDKIPLVSSSLPSAQSVEYGLSDDDQQTFEHLVGWALTDTPAVQWITKEFMHRLAVAIVDAASLNGTDPDSAILGAFGSQYYNGTPHNTGYVGPSLDALKYVTFDDTANLRERWAVVYILTKTRYIDMVLTPLAAQANKTGVTFFLDALGLNSTAVLKRYNEVALTAQMPSSQKYSNGIPDWSFESFESWVRFDFDGPASTWKGCRVSRPEGCHTTNLTSTDFIHPPLSKYELRYQCGTNPSCPLQWYPGKGCYYVGDTPFQSTPFIPGYAARAGALGYRMACGPSGTVSNYLQYARILNFTDDELVLVRMAGMAAMLPVDDHSIYELMLGSDDFMPAGFQMTQSLYDLGQLQTRPIRVSDGTVFQPRDVYSSLCRYILLSDEGAAIFQRMGAAQQTYLSSLLTCGTKSRA